MRTLLLIAAVLVALPAAAADTEAEPFDATPHLEVCRSAAGALGKALKTRLQDAMGEGGPVAALSVCHEEAPAIAAALNDSLHLDVGRTSLRLRNPDNAPDAWELETLVAFEARRAEGERARNLDAWAVVADAEGRRLFRYMKAIPTAPLCLKCHGAEIAPTVGARLAELYPDDAATGFSPGDIRGAFTVTRPLDD